jgi:hypothetical protein
MQGPEAIHQEAGKVAASAQGGKSDKTLSAAVI